MYPQLGSEKSVSYPMITSMLRFYFIYRVFFKKGVWGGELNESNRESQSKDTTGFLETWNG